MPSKHIDKELWNKIQEKHIQMVIETKTSLKDTDVFSKGELPYKQGF